MDNDEEVTVQGLFLKAETDKAFGCQIDPKDQELIWFPKSLVSEHDLERGREGWAILPVWFADKNELNY